MEDKKLREQRAKSVCFFSGDITRSGGTERVSSIIANQLSMNNQFNICFLSLFEKREKTFFPLNRQIKRHRLYNHEVSGAKNILGFIRRIHKFVKAENIDILIDIDGILDMYSVPALKRTKTKLISWEQFNYFQNPYVNYRKYTRKLAAKKADAIVVLTDEDKGYYQSNLEIKTKLLRIYNPMIKKNRKSDYKIQSKTIVTAGRLTEQKGFDMLVEVAAKVFEKHGDWKWLVLGDGEDRQQIEQKLEANNLKNNVILKGNVDNIDEYYEEASMYVLTSRYEGFGLVLTEAKSMRLPCISFKCPAGPAEIIDDGNNGYLIECFDTNKMADKINYLIENNSIRQKFSDKSLDNTDKFDIDVIVEQWERLLKEL